MKAETVMAVRDVLPSQQLRTLESQVINLFLFIYLFREIMGRGRSMGGRGRKPQVGLDPRTPGS